MEKYVDEKSVSVPMTQRRSARGSTLFS